MEVATIDICDQLIVYLDLYYGKRQVQGSCYPYYVVHDLFVIYLSLWIDVYH